MTDISKEAVDALIEYTLNENVFSDAKQELTAQTLNALRAALDEAEARANDYYERWNDCQDKRMKAEAERDAANALLREIEPHLAKISGFFFDTFPRKEIRAHLGAKP